MLKKIQKININEGVRKRKYLKDINPSLSIMKMP
jgi:hypothetical protein